MSLDISIQQTEQVEIIKIYCDGKPIDAEWNDFRTYIAADTYLRKIYEKLPAVTRQYSIVAVSKTTKVYKYFLRR